MHEHIGVIPVRMGRIDDAGFSVEGDSQLSPQSDVLRSHVRHYRPDREAHVLECTNETQKNLGGDGGIKVQKHRLLPGAADGSDLKD